MLRSRRRLALFTLLLVWLTSAVWQVSKPLPEGVGVASPWRAIETVGFLADRTFVDVDGNRHSEQQIFDQALAMIGQARHLVLLDMFLFNDFSGAEEHIFRPLSRQLGEALLARMTQQPDLRVVIITDPVNTAYGSLHPPMLERLQAAGAQVIVTDLNVLRASNPTWTGPWSLCCAWLGNSAGTGWLPNPLGKDPITLRSWLALPNFRANHRKTLVVDHDESWQALVTSANPHDASSAHDNVALYFTGAAALDVLDSEAAVAAFSGLTLHGLPSPVTANPADASVARLRVLSEGAIRQALLETIQTAEPGEALDLAVFYLSDRGVIAALLDAHHRGVRLRVLLDPNEDAFGRKKNGVPNRSVAAELVQAGITLRWCDTHGEQCHAKFLLHHGARHDVLIAGSANFTRRNLANLNLETSVQMIAPASHPTLQAAAGWFDETWFNTPTRHYSIEYARYEDTSLGHRLWYRFGEFSGFSTW